MTHYTDKYGTFFGRLNNHGDVDILDVDEGRLATRLDASVYPIGSEFSARYEHPEGITLSPSDAAKLGIEID